MPQLIDHIDAIARQEQRTVLYLEFHPIGRGALLSYQHERDPLRQEILAWFGANAVPWCPCGEYADENVMASWRGQVYVAVPYDETLPAYQLVRDYLEYPDGKIRFAGVRFLIMPLERANRNAIHDEPGYLDRLWGARFS